MKTIIAIKIIIRFLLKVELNEPLNGIYLFTDRLLINGVLQIEHMTLPASARSALKLLLPHLWQT